MIDTDSGRADAVRYVVLRKLAAGMRHTLMGELQAVQFAADLAAQMVTRGMTGSQLSDAISKISSQTRTATIRGQSIMEWLRPDIGASAELEAGAKECIKLAGEAWFLRGIKGTATCRTPNARVYKQAFFESVVASLLALIDQSHGSLDIDLVGERVDGSVTVRLDARRAERESAESQTLYRAITFDDVQVLAQSHGVRCMCSDATIALEFQPFPD